MGAATEILSHNHIDVLRPQHEQVGLGVDFDTSQSDSNPFDPEILNNVDLLGPQHDQINLEADFDKAETEASPPPFNPEKLKEKYEAERDKRLKHSKGINQYHLVEANGQFSHYLDDPWIESPIHREPVSETVDVVIMGGGYGAQLVAVRLIEAGVKSIRMIEKAGDFGGTWYWNRYPGAQCDIDAYIYMPLLEELGYMPTEKYARSDELLEHARRIGRSYGLYDRVLFQTECHEMHWDDDAAYWTVQTSRNDKIRARFVVPAAGPLHKPKLPGIDGIEDFKGHSFHSSRWDYNYTGGNCEGGMSKLEDKRVAIIGTGATSVQIVPKVANDAKDLYVFQRTPPSVDIRGNRPTDPVWAKSLKSGWQQERMENFDAIVNGGMPSEDLVNDKWTDILHKLFSRLSDANASAEDPEKMAAERQLADFEKMEEIRARADQLVKDKRTAESLKPWYNQLCKRPCFHDEYLQAYNRSNVHLVDTAGLGVERITERGIVANGQEHEVDCIVFATGFELATDWSHRSNMEIYGRGGQTLTSCWKDGASTLHGWTTRNFPNCFWISVMQAGLTLNFLHLTGEQAKHFAYVIGEAQKRRIRTVEPTQEAETAWVKTIVDMGHLREAFLRECTPGYFNNEGTPSPVAGRNATYGAGSPAFLKIMKDWRAKGEFEGLEVTYFDDDEGRKKE